MEYFHAESLVAAILTVGAVDSTGHSSEYMLRRYREMLTQLRSDGGIVQGDIPHKQK